MITIVATIKPAYLREIRSGNKKWEIRKTLPHQGMPFKVLCCESGYDGRINSEFVVDMFHYMNVEDIPDEILKECCVSRKFVEDYANGKPVYLWHISNIVDYCNTKGKSLMNVRDFGLKKAPQSWCYVSRC